MLLLQGVPHAEAWRIVNPGSKASDQAAAELTRRELRFLDEQRALQREKERQDFLASNLSIQGLLQRGFAEDEEDEEDTVEHQCIGVAGQPCENERDGRSKRCSTCRAEHKRRLRRRQNQRYLRKHRMRLNAKRRTRRQKAREWAEFRKKLPDSFWENWDRAGSSETQPGGG
ncbi:MAG: hypothetical protein OXE53_18405 [Deltaproteobacteria bacterium]|nr:hypothetical protein [Deltaproteobacteria bacterium]